MGNYCLGKRAIGSNTKNPKGTKKRVKNQFSKLWLSREKTRRDEDSKQHRWNKVSLTLPLFTIISDKNTPFLGMQMQRD